MWLSMNAIARLFKGSRPDVLRWVETFAEKVYEKPEPGEAVAVELDAMWHYPHSKKQIVDLEGLLPRYRSAHCTGNAGLVIKRP